MEYLVVLKNEENLIIKKFNEIKKWFLNNICNKKIYQYEDDINITSIKSDFFFISPYVFPLLNSYPLENMIPNPQKFLVDVDDNQIAYLRLKKNNIDRIKYSHFLKIFSGMENSPSDLISEFDNKNYLSKLWFYVKEENILRFLIFLENSYFTWSRLNWIKLKMSNRYPNIVFYEGKNKLESKKLVEKLDILVPKTYRVYNNSDEITQEELDELPDCIIKPTNLDGSKLIFKKNSRNILQLETLKKKLKNFDKMGINKELMPMIYAKFKPKIIAEEYVPDIKGTFTKPCEFKFYVFNGKIIFFIAINRKLDYNKFDFYDENFQQIQNDTLSYNRTQIDFDWPQLTYFEEMKKDISKIYDKFTRDLDNSFISRFIRMDFFVTKDKYYFGEFSLFPNGGSGKNLNDFGRKYFVQCWVPEVFSIFQGSLFEIPRLTLKEIDKELVESNNSKFRFTIKDKSKFIDYLFS